MTPERTVATSLHMPQSLHRRLKAMAVNTEDTMGNLMITAITVYLNTLEGKQKTG